MTVCLGVLAFACASAQAPQTETPSVATKRQLSHTIALVSDSCPQVHGGDHVALDWNPGFDHPGAVTGLRGFSLIVARLRDDGTVGKIRTTLSGGGKSHPAVASSLGNGYYHIEIQLPTTMHEGIYLLVDAEAIPEVLPEYEHEPRPQMTVSPVRERFCITVVPHSPPPPSTSTQPGG